MLVSSTSYDCNGVETFEKVSGVEVSSGDRIPLYSSTNGAITADCYNRFKITTFFYWNLDHVVTQIIPRCRSSSSCSAFWIDYDSYECFRLTHSRPSEKKTGLDFNRASAYFERMCLLGKAQIIIFRWCACVMIRHAKNIYSPCP